MGDLSPFLVMLAFLAALQIGVSGASAAPRPIAELVHTRWSAKEGAPAEVRALAQTTDGYLWLGGRQGLVRFDGIRFVRFTPQAGDTVPTAGVERLDSGAASVHPRFLPPDVPPNVLIETLRIDGRELLASGDVAISSRHRDLEIDYTAATLADPERVQFRYRLDGEDPDWHDVGTRRRAYYTGLAPGSYRFRVTASSGDGVWSDTGATLTFRVLPAWYQTFWVRTAIILMIAGLGAAAAAAFQRRQHVRQQEALKGRYEATLAERARIAQDLHDTLLQGFAGVTLQLKAAELALPDEPDVAAETILRVQRLARESLREARARVWDMRETELHDDLTTTLETIARDRAAGTNIEVVVSSSGERRRLTRSVEDAAFRIGREAIVNAVRHVEAIALRSPSHSGRTRYRWKCATTVAGSFRPKPKRPVDMGTSA